MGFLNRLFGKAKTPSPTEPARAVACQHATLVPRWDNAPDMGDATKVSVYRCESCQRDFTPEDAAGVRATIGL